MAGGGIVACGGPNCAGPVDALRRAAGEAVEVSRHCLGPCDHANVVVVRPDPQARDAGARPTWFAFVSDAAAHDVAGWVAAGGPGTDLPDLLDLHRFVPARSGQSDPGRAG